MLSLLFGVPRCETSFQNLVQRGKIGAKKCLPKVAVACLCHIGNVERAPRHCFSVQVSRASYSLADKLSSWRRSRAGQPFNHLRRRHHLRILAVQIGQGHRMHLVRRSWRARIIDLSKRKTRIGDHLRGKAQIARRARARLDGIVRADAGHEQLADAAHAQPAFQSRMDEGIRHIFLHDMLFR